MAVEGWTIISGNWYIQNYELREPGNPGSIIIENTPSNDPGKGLVYVEAIDPQIGQDFVVYIDWLDSSHYHKVIFTKTTSSVWHIALYDITTLLAEGDQEEDVVEEGVTPLRVCIDGINFTGSIPSLVDCAVWISNQVLYGGLYSGLGHNNSILTRFDDFYYYETREHDLECAACRCSCLQKGLPKTLTLTFTNCTDRAACLEGEEITLDWECNSFIERWHGEGSGVTAGWIFNLACSDNADAKDITWPGKNLNLQKEDQTCARSVNGECEMGALDVNCLPNQDSTCDPLVLNFGPLFMSISDLICETCYAPLEGPDSGEYSIVITE